MHAFKLMSMLCSQNLFSTWKVCILKGLGLERTQAWLARCRYCGELKAAVWELVEKDA